MLLSVALILHCLIGAPTWVDGEPLKVGRWLGSYELKAPLNQRYETFRLAGQGVVDKIQVGVVLPARFDRTKPHPVILFLGGHMQQHHNWEDWCARFFDVSRLQGFAQEWLVIAPIGPEGMNSVVLLEEIPRLLDAVRARYVVEGGLFHLIGQSNGGALAFEIAIRDPDQFASLTAHTGAARTRQTELLTRLHPLHIFMYCGKLDGGFMRMKESAHALMASGHRRLQFVTFPGTDHWGILEQVAVHKQLEDFWYSLELLRNNATVHEEILQLEPPPTEATCEEQASDQKDGEP